MFVGCPFYCSVYLRLYSQVVYFIYKKFICSDDKLNVPYYLVQELYIISIHKNYLMIV